MSRHVNPQNIEQRHINYMGMRATVVLEVSHEGWTYQLFIGKQMIQKTARQKACADREQAYAHAKARALDIMNCEARRY